MHSLMCRIRTQMASSFRVQILTNKRSAGVLNRTQYPSDVIALVVLWRLRHRLTLQELSEMVLERGIVFSHETVREWAAKLTPILAAERRHRRRGKGGAERRSWHGDESSRPVGLSLPRHRPQWRPDRHHVERAPGQGAAKAFSATGMIPGRVTTDGHRSYPCAIRSTLGRQVPHRTSAHRTNGLEQDHRGIKGRIQCMRGFKALDAAERFCRGYDERRACLRLRTRHCQPVSAIRRRLLHLRRAAAVLAILQPA
jgi:putative transposase